MAPSKAQALARELLREHGLTAWTFRFDRSVRRFGQCNGRRQRITLSRKLVELNSPERVRNTLLHEIAHALVGARAGHGPAWVKQARAIGNDGQRCYSAATTVTVPPPLTGTCPGCGKVTLGFKRRSVACKACCVRAGGGYRSEFALVWRRTTPQ